MDDPDVDSVFAEKAKRVAKRKPSPWTTQLAAVVLGFVLIMCSVAAIGERYPVEPRWQNTLSPSAIGAPSLPILTIILLVCILIFYGWCWRQSRGIAVLMGFLHIFGFGACLVGASFWGFPHAKIITTLDTPDASYVLVTRDIAGNGKLDIYRCINEQCQGREIAWDEWSTYSDATLSIEGNPPQLVVNALGKICFDLDNFDRVMETYVTRPETRRDTWQDGCREA